MTAFRTLEISDPALAPPGLRFVTVKSAALGQRADITLYVPPQTEGLRDVPIVTLLHGVYGSHWAWAFKGGAHLTAQRLVDAGDLPPVVLAMPSDGLWGDGSGYLPHASQDFERWIVEEVPAAVQQACAACGPASPQGIAGLSMGGFGALRLAARHAGRYVAAAGHSSVTDAAQLGALIQEPRTGWVLEAADNNLQAAWCNARGPRPALRFDCGLQDPLLAANRQLHQALQVAGIAHDYAEHPGGHDWAYWGRHLEDTLRFFGAALRRRAPA
jgi:putative tributyrin esterase